MRGWLLLAVAVAGCAAAPPAARPAPSEPVPLAGGGDERPEPAPLAAEGDAADGDAADGHAAGGDAPAADAPAAPAPPIVTIRLSVEVERAVDTAVYAAMARREMPGVVVAVGRREGLSFLRPYGDRARDPARELTTTDTIYDLASLTKVVATTTALALLVDRGMLAWDDPVAAYLPAFAANGKDAITVRQLLTHTSGLPAIDALAAYEGEDRDGSIARILAMPPAHPPGARVVYSDLGFVVLGELVSAITREPFDAFVAREVLAPLGMRDAGFRPSPTRLPRIAPTERAERRDGVLIRGEVHDPRAFRLGGVSGNAGLFASASDLARFARFMLGEGELEGRHLVRADTIQALTTPARLPAGIVRGLGWDMRSPSEAREHGGMSPRAFGHSGWTGTALWIDPERDLFLVVLSNRVHPDGHGDARPLTAELEHILASAGEPFVPAPRAELRAGIDVEREAGWPTLRDARVVLLTHDAARARDGMRTLDVLAREAPLTLLRVLAPEHGLGVDREGAIEDTLDAATQLPVHGLFGPTRTPTPEMLEGADTLVIDLVDVGVRFYTYAATMHRALEAAAAASLRVVVLDRPNPLGGAIVEGPPLDPDLTSFVNHHPLPLRHGLTFGEMAALLDRDLALGLGERLAVIEPSGCSREHTILETRTRWVPPSPNLRDPEAVMLYPSVALLEGTDVSVGRGTSEPFHVIGAPWMSPDRVLAELAAAGPLGATFEATTFTPRAARHRGRRCRGIRITLTGAPREHRVLPLGLALVRAVHAAHPDHVDLERVLPLLGSRELLETIASP